MQFKRLRLSGFKSFVDPVDLDILPGITGVVGPNGCGKSNLLEALRWVMGETSYKSMRGSGMEDVIFAGTNARPARNHAEVLCFWTIKNATPRLSIMIRKNWRLSGVLSVMPVLPIALIAAMCARAMCNCFSPMPRPVRGHLSGAAGTNR